MQTTMANATGTAPVAAAVPAVKVELGADAAQSGMCDLRSWWHTQDTKFELWKNEALCDQLEKDGYNMEVRCRAYLRLLCYILRERQSE